MSETQDRWELWQGETLIGTLTIFDQDMFWFSALFEPTAAFEPYRPTFDEGNRVRTADDADAWAAWHDKLNGLGLHLVRLRDQAVASEFILYIDGREAEFRPRFDT